MKTLFRNTLLAAALLALTCTSATPHLAAQGMSAAEAALSPAATASAKFDGKSVTIRYNTPHMRGRKIMGGLVPYGEVWRTGANPATTFITATALKIGALDVPAGTYTLYTLPAAPGKPWQLIINKQTGQWGTEYNQKMDFGRTPLMSKPLAAPQEVMSISFESVSGKTADMHIRWEKTDEWIKIEAR